MKFLAIIVAALSASSASAYVKRTADTVNPIRSQAMQDKEDHWRERMEQGVSSRPSVKQQQASCIDGSVTIDGEVFGCDGIDFESFIALGDSNIPVLGGSTSGADIWGWLSPEGKEITLWCLDNGLWFVDSTDPANPLQLGYLPSGHSRKYQWCDVKVYEDVAYVVKDGRSLSSTYGIEVFDLNRLAGLSEDPTRSFTPDFVYRDHGKSHNLFVEPNTGFLYSVGTNTCNGGLHIASLANKLQPEYVACADSDGYTHDAQCVVYDGPDGRYTGNEICFAYNEDTVTIWDVTNKGNIRRLARLGYDNSAYTHQGWATNDLRHLIMNDELDEREGLSSTTKTYFINIESLTNPFIETTFIHDEVSVDHNLYVWGAIHRLGQGGNPPLGDAAPSDKYAYLSNYVAGIKVLDVSALPTVTQAGYFDVAPDLTGNTFDGTWSNYMHPSGVLAVSSIDRGLFFLRPKMAFDNSAPVPAPTNPPADVQPTPFPTVPPTPPPTCTWFFC